MMMNERVEIHFKSVTTKVFKALLVELSTDIGKPKGSLEASNFII